MRTKQPDDDMTLGEARQELRDNFEKGIECRCCHQFVKRYGRKLNSAMTQVLIIIYKYFQTHIDDEWLHVDDYLKVQPIPSSLRGDFSKLRYWGLIEAKKGERPDGSRRVGLYRITEKGKAFVEDRLLVPEKIYLYNQKFLGFSDHQISIKTALGVDFNYQELMNS